MKKYLIMLLMMPLIALAYETSTRNTTPGFPLTDEEMSDEAETASSRCMKNSDMYCYKKFVGAVCVTDPQPPYGRSGICQQRGSANNRGEVSCLCR